MAQPTDPDVPGLDELGHIDTLLEHRVRLAVSVLLSRHEAFSFSRLKELLHETDGNLGAHLRKLEDAGYVSVEKTYRNRRPVTWYRLTAKGRRQLERHLDGLAQLLERAGNAPHRAGGRR